MSKSKDALRQVQLKNGLDKFTQEDPQLFINIFTQWIKAQKEQSLSSIVSDCTRSIYESEHNNTSPKTYFTDIYPDLHRIISACHKNQANNETVLDNIIMSRLLRNLLKQDKRKVLLTVSHHLCITNQHIAIEWFKDITPLIRGIYIS